MGGYGSGRRLNKKPETTSYLELPISRFKKSNRLIENTLARGTWCWSCNNETIASVEYEVMINDKDSFVRFMYLNKTENKSYDYKVMLTSTSPHFGGKRWWFTCPANHCGKRVGILYLANIFACRTCLNLAYPSQNDPPHYRALHKAQKIHTELGGTGCTDDWVLKPKGMHQKTFDRKKAIMENANAKAWILAAEKFGITF